jgi:hypothetical protein
MIIRGLDHCILPEAKNYTCVTRSTRLRADLSSMLTASDSGATALCTCTTTTDDDDDNHTLQPQSTFGDSRTGIVSTRCAGNILQFGIINIAHAFGGGKHNMSRRFAGNFWFFSVVVQSQAFRSLRIHTTTTTTPARV